MKIDWEKSRREFDKYGRDYRKVHHKWPSEDLRWAFLIKLVEKEIPKCSHCKFRHGLWELAGNVVRDERLGLDARLSVKEKVERMYGRKLCASVNTESKMVD